MVTKQDVTTLYERYGHTIYRRALTLLRNEEEAKDTMQEIFTQFFAKRGSFRGDSSAFTYLYRMTTNRCIDRLRRQSKIREQPLSNEAIGPEAGPEQVLAQREELVVALHPLKPITQTIAVLAFVDQLKQEEIAAALSISRRTVGKHLKKLRNLVKTDESEEPAIRTRGTEQDHAQA